MRQVILKARPAGAPKPSDFVVEAVADPKPAAGEVLLRTLWMSLDPYMRFALDEKGLGTAPGLPLGGVPTAGTVSEVVASNSPDFKVGDVVEGRSRWSELAVVNPAQTPLRKLTRGAFPLSAALGAIGMPGQTAYGGMIPIGRVQAGETVVISAAAGAVGSIAGQIGKILGARVVGIAGGAAKCAAVEALGFDACIDYKAPDYAAKLAAACPGGVDVYFENVGGAVTDAVLPLLKYGARMPMCGFISYYGMGDTGPGPDRLPSFMRMVMLKGLELRGFSGSLSGKDALDQLAQWVTTGRIKIPEKIVEGLDKVPEAFADIFRGNANVGKLVIRVAADA